MLFKVKTFQKNQRFKKAPCRNTGRIGTYEQVLTCQLKKVYNEFIILLPKLNQYLSIRSILNIIVKVTISIIQVIINHENNKT